MKWDKHIRYIIKKTKYLIFAFAKIKNMMDTKTLIIIYYAFLLSQRESFVTVKIFESKILINFNVFEHPESE